MVILSRAAKARAKMLRPAAFLFLIGSVSPVFGEDAQQNVGLLHPDVVAVRSIYRVVEKGIASRLLKEEKRTVEGCGPYEEDRQIYSDDAGVVRKYVWQGGSGDSALTIRQYYDSQERLRFVFATGGAVNGSKLEHRIYFDARGMRIRQTRSLKVGPGWTFPQFSDEEGLLSSDPRQAYDKDCGDPGQRK